tara:strand:- start:1173 stop:1511 length:339 start_codon:yes stop_codon:yes gene_type:complete
MKSALRLTISAAIITMLFGSSPASAGRYDKIIKEIAENSSDITKRADTLSPPPRTLDPVYEPNGANPPGLRGPDTQPPTHPPSPAAQKTTTESFNEAANPSTTETFNYRADQ